MATFVLIHGAGSTSWYWHLVEPVLRSRGHAVVAVDLPVDDDRAGLADYADLIEQAIGDHSDLVLVAQSLAGFTAPLVCERIDVDLMILVAAMVPVPGESPGEWWENTGHEAARRAQAALDGVTWEEANTPEYMFLHDVPADLVAESVDHLRGQSATPFARTWPLDRWPDVATRFLLCGQDRFFPAEFQRRVVRERLGIEPDEIDCGHLPALARPAELGERLLAYRAEWERTP